MKQAQALTARGEAPDAVFPDRLRTERLDLRPLREDEAERLFALFAHWPVVRFLSSPPWPYRLDDAQGFVRHAASIRGAANEAIYAIDEGGVLVGSIHVRMRPPSHLQRAFGPNIGYWLGEPYWGRGYMSEAVRGLAAEIFRLNRGVRIFSGAFAGNAASLRVQEKVGFVRDGETLLYSRPLDADLPHVNTVLTRAHFEERRAAGWQRGAGR